MSKTLYLMNMGTAGDRIVDISIQSRRMGSETHIDNPELQDVTETLRTVVIPVVDPFKITQTTEYLQGLGEWPGLADLRTFDGDFWDNGKVGEASVKTRIECAGPSSLVIESITMERHVRHFPGLLCVNSLGYSGK